jgi:hypothetical protein
MKMRVLALLTLSCVACGPPPRPDNPRPEDLRDITEARAGELVAEVCGEAGVAVAAQWPVNVGQSEPFEVDYRVGSGTFGIEWVSPQDRASFDEVLPRPNPNGQLQIIAGARDDAQAQILVLEYSSYRYDPDVSRVQRGSLGVRDMEGRVRRDIRDFLHYVRGQGGI